MKQENKERGTWMPGEEAVSRREVVTKSDSADGSSRVRMENCWIWGTLVSCLSRVVGTKSLLE